MTYVVTDNWITCRYTGCEPERAAEALFSEDDAPDHLAHFLKLNAELAREWPVITEMKDAPEDPDAWDGVPNKLPYLER